MRKLSIFPIFLALFSCGSNNDYVDVTVITPFGMQRKFHELKNELFNQESASLFGATCEQRQIFAGTTEKVGDNKIYTRRLKVLANMTSAILPSSTNQTCTFQSTNAECIITNTFFPEKIVIPVKKGETVDIGIIGAFYKRIDQNNDNTCDDSETNNGTASLIGHKTVNYSEPATVALPIWVQESNPSTQASISNKELIEIKVDKNGCSTGQNNQLAVIYAEYFNDYFSKEGVFQSLTSASTSGGTNIYYYYIPSVFPIKLRYKQKDGTFVTQTILDATWADTSGGNNCTISLTNLK